jgi:hypothetical protein
MPGFRRDFSQRRIQALKAVHGITVITKNHLVIRYPTLSVVNTTAVLPRSRPRICPSKVALAEFQHPCMVQALELLGHVIRDMPDCGAVLVVNFTIVPNLLIKSMQCELLANKIHKMPQATQYLASMRLTLRMSLANCSGTIYFLFMIRSRTVPKSIITSTTSS